MTNAPALDFNFAYGVPKAEAVFRLKNEDFIVREDLGFELSGEGEHLYLFIKKEGENTSWVAEKLAAFFKVKSMDVSYCGKKDRNAITYQWFSIYLPGLPLNDTDTKWQALPEQCGFVGEVLNAKRHLRKLRRGDHARNHFQIRLRDIAAADDVLARLEKIKSTNVPNYFGEQRFGRNGSNLEFAQRWFEGGEKIKNRGKRSMVMSAARSYLFNQVLSARVEKNNWREVLNGDPLTQAGEASAPLWGRGRLKSSVQCFAFETEILNNYALWCEQLEHLGLSQERRALVLNISHLNWRQEDKHLLLEFALPPGQYATALLRELCVLKTPERSED